MNSNPADTVHTTTIDADAANPSDQPNPVLNKNADNAESERPSAIERQRVAIQSGAAPNRIDQKTLPPPPATPRSRFAAYFDGLCNCDGSRFGRRASLALLLIAASLLLMFGTFRALKTENVPQAELAQVTKTLQKIPAPGASSEVDDTAPIAIPISDVSLRVRPELLQQLVAIYRLRLVADPNNSVATTTLSRIREHSLAELDVISATESAPLATDSLRLAAKLFPELANDPRYRSIAARISTSGNNMAQSQRPAAAVTQQPATQQPAPATTPVRATQPAPATTPALATQPAQPLTPASISTPQSAAAVASRKPQVRVISLTPGIIRKDRFIPADGGDVFRLNIGYRHRDNPLANQPGSGLVAQLSESGSSKLLAEVPVEITGSSGEKSLLIGTSEKVEMGKFYNLNFTVDGHVLPSHTVLTRQRIP